MTQESTTEKGGSGFEGVRLLLCENPLPPIDEAIDAARAELPRSNHYTEAYSEPLRDRLADRAGVSAEHIHVNAGSELILRQLFDRFGEQVHLLTPTYPLFPEIADRYTETRLRPEDDFQFDLRDLEIPEETTLAVIVNPNNPNGSGFDMEALPGLLEQYPETRFLVDEAFVDFVENPVANLVPEYDNLFVTRTLSKAHSLAGFRIGYAVLPESVAAELNASNDAYPLARPSQAAAIATLDHHQKIEQRVDRLRSWADQLASELESVGVTTFPSQTYFFLADVSPHDADEVAAKLRERKIFIKPLGDDRLGAGYLRVMTARPEDNERVVEAFREIL
ncbi:pyridoxal phosphate-dependent aminotransferase [Halobellus inordinatus]|uniref:pyridoxal phosphate-dependent aminotransferase n=1 Tax=Halobellus inordinatus TaxID=1126236 RepID=UPI00210AA90C|nr:histidinol-phosphate transaminase [Halobellus inordinatus]